jgi:hypothetical protein
LNWIHVLPGLFIDRWFSFFFGVLIWWILERAVSPIWFWIYLSIVGVAVIGDAQGGNIGVVLTTLMTIIGGGAIYAVARLDKLTSLLSNFIIQFLGRISYSLYLIHIPIGGMVESFGLGHWHRSPTMAFIWMGFAIAASIMAAYVMYRLVERPGVELGKRFKYRSSAPPTGENVSVDHEKAMV